MKNSKKAKQYDFLVKTGVTQDDIGFMSVLDTPMVNPLNGEHITLDEYIAFVANESIRLENETRQIQENLIAKFEVVKEQFGALNNKYNTLNTEYEKILEIGATRYLQMLLTT